jgi:predicted ATPase
VGKTRLAAEAARAAHERGALVLWGASYQQEGRAPYAPFIEALEGYLAARPLEERNALAASFPDLVHLLPSLDAEGRDRPHRNGSQSEEEAGRLLLFAAVVRFLSGLAKSRPLVLLLDDLHLVDAASLQLLHHLARAAPDQRWLIVGTYRDEDVEAGGAFDRLRSSLTRSGLCLPLDLLRLSRPDCDALVSTLLPGGGPSEDLLDRIYELSLGNPLFAGELVEAVRAMGLVLHDGQWVLPEVAVEVPAQVRHLILERVRHLEEPARQVLALAAVAGMETDFGLLRLATDLDDGTVLDALDAALNARLLDERDVPGARTGTPGPRAAHRGARPLPAPRRPCPH